MWDKELGVTYIPWFMIPTLDLNMVEDGGIIDEESLPDHMQKGKLFDINVVYHKI